jgi:hypothetical protein
MDWELLGAVGEELSGVEREAVMAAYERSRT